jgi:hypothetical protein
VDADVRVEIHGEIPERFAAQLRALDRRGVVEMTRALPRRATCPTARPASTWQ